MRAWKEKSSNHVVNASALLAVIVTYYAYLWTQVTPRVDWSPAPPVPFKENCPPGLVPMMVFGGTSMLGKYIVHSFTEQEPGLCVINFGRSKCKSCHINIKGDLRDTRLVGRSLAHYKPQTVLTSVKPPLLGVHYRTFIELNMLAMIELIKLAKQHAVRNFIYVGSIAAANHYTMHDMGKESDPSPYYTDYEAPYDVSKRVAEDFLLAQHETGVFNCVSIRTSGIVGGDGDPYDNLRWPVYIRVEPNPSLVECNYAGNIADALVVVHRTMQKHPEVGGKFYYYTGEKWTENDKYELLAPYTQKRFIDVPLGLFVQLTEFAHWARWDPNVYWTVDLSRMGLVNQTFDQSKFHNAFPDFTPKVPMAEALIRLYAKNEKI